MKSRFLMLILIILSILGWSCRKGLRDALLPSPSKPYLTAHERTFIQAGIAYRSGQTQIARSKMDQTILERLHVRQRRLQNTNFLTNIDEKFEKEWRVWERQWETEAERQKRLTAQQLNENELKKSIQENLWDEAWLDRYLRRPPLVTDTELRNVWSHVKEQRPWHIPPIWRVAHLFLAQSSAEVRDRSSQIRSLHEKLVNGEPWAACVQTHSEDSRSRGHAGELGWMTTRRIPADFAAALQKLKPGEISQPIQTRLGWHLIKVLDYQPSRASTFEEARSELTSRLDQRLMNERLTELRLQSGFTTSTHK